jgi:hypothetical protein
MAKKIDDRHVTDVSRRNILLGGTTPSSFSIDQIVANMEQNWQAAGGGN